MADPRSKGLALEQAVASIEQAILRQVPSLAAANLRIETRKIVTVCDVRHEFDIWVAAETAPNGHATFVFECKNTKAKVGKNDIIVFSTKLRAVGAQAGFFVAREYTRDAEAQAKLDQRLRLLRVSEPEYEAFLLPFHFHWLVPDKVSGSVGFFERGAGTSFQHAGTDVRAACATLDGTPLNVATYIDTWTEALTHDRCQRFHTHHLPAGRYDLTAREERRFGLGQLIVDGHDTESAVLDLTIVTQVVRPAIRSHFHVSGRGRFWSFDMELDGKPLPQAMTILGGDTT